VLFAADLSGKLVPEHINAVFDDVLREFSLPSRALSRARSLAVGVAQNLGRIDKCIGEASTHWKIARLASVERNVLRVATFELLLEPETPAEVVLDEAVEIARRFAGEQSRSFVNGVLDVIVRQARGREA
jgi:transcription antitermination protein NusB